MAFRGTNGGKAFTGQKAMGPFNPSKPALKGPMPGKATKH